MSRMQFPKIEPSLLENFFQNLPPDLMLLKLNIFSSDWLIQKFHLWEIVL